MLKPLILALQFLTRLPVNISVDFERENISRSTIFFPLVGMLIGAIAAVIFYLLSFINKDLAALAGVFTLVMVTGGLHIDGLSDTADGFFSSRPKEKILEIMKDSRVGAFGVIAIIFDILFKFVLLKNMQTLIGVMALTLSCGIGRSMIALMFSFGKTARPGGLGELFMNKNSKKYFVIAVLIFIIIGCFLGKIGFLAALFAALIFTLLFMRYSYKLIGGLTGDVYGANCELCEIVSLIVFLVAAKFI
ncbi:MAG: adenosylcobinamide-GDP ribazoletransferase [Bacillota bacterium]|nr:adenosylcobinamide-GDP ribazoletransferase [Bacillota bacterium]